MDLTKSVLSEINWILFERERLTMIIRGDSRHKRGRFWGIRMNVYVIIRKLKPQACAL